MSKRDYESWDKAKLARRAKKLDLDVTREDGDEDKDPTKDDYIAALKANDGESATDSSEDTDDEDTSDADTGDASDESTASTKSKSTEAQASKKGKAAQKSDQPAGQVALRKEDLPPQRAIDAPVGLETTTGLAPRRGKQTGSGGLEADPRTQEEIDEENAKALEERGVHVKAIARGEYPAGILREAGDIFDYVQPEDHADRGLPLPSWMVAVDEDGKIDKSGPKTRAPSYAYEPGLPKSADQAYTRDDFLAGRKPRSAEAVKDENDTNAKRRIKAKSKA